MKDLLERLVALVPAYFSELLRLTTGPKQFLAERVGKHRPNLEEPLLFLAACYMITFALKLPFGRSDPLIELANDAIYVFLGVLLFGYAAYLAWRLVGATGPIQKFFLIHFYIAGVLTLISTGTYLVALGVLRAGAPGSHAQMLKAVYSGDAFYWFSPLSRLLADRPHERGAWLVAMFVAYCGVAAGLVWVITAWGAYRRLTSSSKHQSVVAFLLFCLFSIPVLIFTVVVGNALVG